MPFPRWEEKINRALTALTWRKNPQDCSTKPPSKMNIIIIIIIIIYKFLERHILKALWRFTILKINKKLQKTIKSLSKKKGLEAPFECV